MDVLRTVDNKLYCSCNHKKSLANWNGLILIPGIYSHLCEINKDYWER